MTRKVDPGTRLAPADGPGSGPGSVGPSRSASESTVSSPGPHCGLGRRYHDPGLTTQKVDSGSCLGGLGRRSVPEASRSNTAPAARVLWPQHPSGGGPCRRSRRVVLPSQLPEMDQLSFSRTGKYCSNQELSIALNISSNRTKESSSERYGIFRAIPLLAIIMMM